MQVDSICLQCASMNLYTVQWVVIKLVLSSECQCVAHVLKVVEAAKKAGCLSLGTISGVKEAQKSGLPLLPRMSRLWQVSKMPS